MACAGGAGAAIVVPDVAVKVPLPTPTTVSVAVPVPASPASPSGAVASPLASASAVVPAPAVPSTPPAPTASDGAVSPAGATTGLVTHAGAAAQGLTRAAGGGLAHVAGAADVTKDTITAPADTAALVRHVTEIPASPVAGAATQVTRALTPDAGTRLSQTLNAARETLDVSGAAKAVLGSGSGGDRGAGGGPLGEAASAALGRLPGATGRGVSGLDSPAGARDRQARALVGGGRTLRPLGEASSAADRAGGGSVTAAGSWPPIQLAADTATGAATQPLAAGVGSSALPCNPTWAIAPSHCRGLGSAALGQSGLVRTELSTPALSELHAAATRAAHQAGADGSLGSTAPGGPNPASAASSGLGAAGPAPLMLLLGIVSLALAVSSRRLRFARMPTRPAPFALIPARPG
jgi:hypothetical protein